MHALPVFPLQVTAIIVATVLFTAGGFLADKHLHGTALAKVSFAGLAGIGASVLCILLQKLGVIGEWGTIPAAVFLTGVFWPVCYVVSEVFTNLEIRRYPYIVCGAVTLALSIVTALVAVVTKNSTQPLWLMGELSFVVMVFGILAMLVTYADFDKEPIGTHL